MKKLKNSSVRAKPSPSSEAARLASDAYVAACHATPKGRASEVLRREGHECSAGGDEVGAPACFSRALDLFSNTDLGAAASAARYDFAESLRRTRRADELELIAMQRALLEDAERSPERRRDPRRYGMTLDALATVMRDWASSTHDDGACRDALRCHDRAIRTLEGTGSFGVEERIFAMNARAITLGRLGRRDDAIAEYERVVSAWESVDAASARASDPRRFVASTNLANALVRRAEGDDVARARTILERVIDVASESRTVARLQLAEMLVGAEDLARAREVLESLKVADLGPRELARAAHLLRVAGDSERALKWARWGQDDARRRRHDTAAIHHADREALDLQAFAAVEANILADSSRPVDAFLAMEKASAARMHEEVSRQAWCLVSPLARALAGMGARVSVRVPPDLNTRTATT